MTFHIFTNKLIEVDAVKINNLENELEYYLLILRGGKMN